MKIDLEKAITYLQEDIKEKQDQIELIRSIDWNSTVDEETWHKICETPLRTSDLLAKLLKNIFPKAEDINVDCNYVYFKMYGFRCSLPTSCCRGCYVDTSWYKKDYGEPTNIYWTNEATMKKYFEAKDNKENWETLFNYRLPKLKYCKKWYKFVLWFLKYKWEDDHRAEWESKFEENDVLFRKRIEKYFVERKEIHDRSTIMFEILIPELKMFSDQIYTLNNSVKVDEIAKLEGKNL